MASRNLRMRISELEAMLDAILFVREEIRYRLAPVEEILISLSRMPAGRLLPVFGPLGARGFDPGKVEAAVEEVRGRLHLGREELSLLCEFLSGLGGSDGEGQVSRCDLYAERVRERLSRLVGESEKKIKLYNTFGVLTGLFISLLLL